MRKTTVGYSEYIVKATNGLEKREGEIERKREKQKKYKMDYANQEPQNECQKGKIKADNQNLV